MNSSFTDESAPSPHAKKALQIIRRLSNRDQTWILEQIESMQRLNIDELSPEWRTELASRIQSLQDGTAELYDLDEIEREVDLP